MSAPFVSRRGRWITAAARLALAGLVAWLALPASAAPLARGYAAYLATGFSRLPLAEALVATGSFLWWAFLHAECWRLGVPKIGGRPPAKAAPPDVPFWVAANLVLYLGPLHLLHVLRPKAPPSPEPPSGPRLLAEVAFGVWAYDFLFYWCHLALHRVRRLAYWHLHHHSHYKTCVQGQDSLDPTDTFRQHFLDGAAQVGVNILVQQLSPVAPAKHTLSRLVHNVAVTYLLVEAHSGYDLPWMSHRLLPWLFGGAPRHQRHHLKGTVYFHQFFRYLDDFFGFVEAPAPGPPADDDWVKVASPAKLE